MTEKELSTRFPALEEDLIKELFKVGNVKMVKEGDLLMRTGQNIRSALLVINGLIKIYREDSEGNEFFMYYINSGKACAMSLVCAMNQKTSGLMAKAVSNSTIISVPLHDVNEWMGKYKSWAEFAVSSYRERFEEQLETVDHIAFRNMDERLLFHLKRHQKQLGTNLLSIPFTEIAQELNSSREVISRLIKKLVEKGMIKLHGSKIELLNMQNIV